ncbi:hypothetical protein [Isoptericola aurantiacus]|uniref:hypothetical protein n=1 Tax=Isoptericola aurantiacus TaxID=3377839 RepID=UPI00383AAD99
MKRRFLRRTAAGTALGLAALGVGGTAVAAPTAPAPAPTAVVQVVPATTELQPATARVTRAVASRSARSGDVADLLQDLVDDGVLSADERDAIAADVARASAPADDERLFSLQSAAEVLGTDAAGLRAALSQDGATLATVAAASGIMTDDLVDALTAVAGEHVDLAAARGLIDADEAAGRRAALAAVVADAVQAEYPDPLRGGATTNTV